MVKPPRTGVPGSMALRHKRDLLHASTQEAITEGEAILRRVRENRNHWTRGYGLALARDRMASWPRGCQLPCLLWLWAYCFVTARKNSPLIRFGPFSSKDECSRVQMGDEMSWWQRPIFCIWVPALDLSSTMEPVPSPDVPSFPPTQLG